MPDQRSILRLRNTSEQPMSVFVQPWPQRIPLAPGERLEVVASSEIIGAFEVELAEGGAVVRTWYGATVRVFIDGEELNPGITRRRCKRRHCTIRGAAPRLAAERWEETA